MCVAHTRRGRGCRYVESFGGVVALRGALLKGDGSC